MICQGAMINTQNNKITLKLASLNDEYIGCPLFISVKCDEQVEWCEWAGIGYLKPQNSDCSHIRIINCLYDNDCSENQICNNPDKYDWRKRNCQEQQNNQTRTIRPETTGYTIMPPSKHGYSPQYVPEDLPKSFFDTIVKIIRAIGNFFSGGK